MARDSDRALLYRCGIPEEKIVIIFGDRELEYEAACKYSPYAPEPYRIELERLLRAMKNYTEEEPWFAEGGRKPWDFYK